MISLEIVEHASGIVIERRERGKREDVGEGEREREKSKEGSNLIERCSRC